MDVDTRLLRYFVAVAGELSFTRAAERLFVSQPTLSKQIQKLEGLLRTPLFERTGREIRLTPAGSALLPAARRLVADWQATVSAVQAASLVLRVGYGVTGAGRLTAAAHAAFAGRNPDVAVEPKCLEWGGEVAALRSGTVDVAFVWLPAATDGLHIEVVARECWMAGLPAAHRLAAAQVLTGEDLGGAPIVWVRTARADWLSWWYGRWYGRPGLDPSRLVWGPAADNVDELLQHVAAGSGICVAPGSMAAYYTRPDVVWRPLAGVEPLTIAIGWPDSREHPLVNSFVSLVRELARPADGENRREPSALWTPAVA